MAEGARYPIGAVAKLTGLPPMTLRAWERRYRVVQPERDARGRTYSERDLAKLKLLKGLVERGHPIGRLAALSGAQLRALHAEEPAPESAGPALPLDALLSSLERFDLAGFEAELGRLAALLPARELVGQVVLPLLEEIGEAWSGGRLSVAHEHLASAALRNLLGTLLRLKPPSPGRPRLLFATPSHEQHEFGLLAAAMLAAAAGFDALYLGPNLPAAEIARAARVSGARVVVLAATGAAAAAKQREGVRTTLELLEERSAVWIGGALAPRLERELGGRGARFLGSLVEFEEALAGLEG